MFIHARDYDEAWNKIFDDYADDVLSEFVRTKKCTINIEYGSCRRYEYNGADDYDCQTDGVIELTLGEFIEELGYCEFLEMIGG